MVKTLLEEKKLRTTRRALDNATEEIIQHAESIGIDTVFTRQAKYDGSFLGFEKSRCYFGSLAFVEAVWNGSPQPVEKKLKMGLIKIQEKLHDKNGQ